MRLRFEQLAAHLAKGLAPVYLVHGDEPLLLQEAGDVIRQAARAQGYAERVCLTVETGFVWPTLLHHAANQSLFADKRLLELRLDNAKPGDEGSKTLCAYTTQLPPDVVLLVTAGKLDPASQKSRWFTALDTAGVILPLWPIDRQRLPAWIEQRLIGKGLRPTPEAVALLVERVEGNLLAAAQEIDKLYLLYGTGPLDAEQIMAAVSDSARYNIYELVDAGLAGQAARAARILSGLRGEGLEPVLVAWALHREIRLLNLLAFELGKGQSTETALTRHKVWEKRKPLLRQALQRLSLASCRALLRACSHLDQAIKGAVLGDPWDMALQISLGLAGQPWLTTDRMDER
ncbi:MAG: DNA polymerase III subunit delta [Gammaproteobacteria bacterium]|nr:DNA polymerase III subunit delta [Gammaproteobacteria bacterium]MCP5423994.1 DNA polymerase III subunit delta [Gammaproteobacteria bacterium]